NQVGGDGEGEPARRAGVTHTRVGSQRVDVGSDSGGDVEDRRPVTVTWRTITRGAVHPPFFMTVGVSHTGPQNHGYPLRVDTFQPSVGDRLLCGVQGVAGGRSQLGETGQGTFQGHTRVRHRVHQRNRHVGVGVLDFPGRAGGPHHPFPETVNPSPEACYDAHSRNQYFVHPPLRYLALRTWTPECQESELLFEPALERIEDTLVKID